MADDSFERFYTATYARLLRQLALVTGDRGDAEELLQEAFGRAALRWRRLSDYEAPEAWVRRVAMNLAAERARRLRRRARAILRPVRRRMRRRPRSKRLTCWRRRARLARSAASRIATRRTQASGAS